jgi:hypothetical protein
MMDQFAFQRFPAQLCEVLFQLRRMVKIFVGNLTDECTNEDLQTLFGQVSHAMPWGS